MFGSNYFGQPRFGQGYAAAPITVTLGRATETDGALAATHAKRIPLAEPSATDTALAVAARHSISTGLAAESDSAVAASHAKNVRATEALESDAALSVTAQHRLSVGVAAETESPMGANPRHQAVESLATELDSALAGSPVHRLSAAAASETDSSLAATPKHRVHLNYATEVDSVLSPGAQTVTCGLASETDTAVASTAKLSSPTPTAGGGPVHRRLVRTPMLPNRVLSERSDLRLILPQTVALGLALERDQALAVMVDNFDRELEELLALDLIPV
jgi:hypothetical protein